MDKFEVILEVNPILETNESSFVFKNIRINIYKEKENINKLGFEIEAIDRSSAEKLFKIIIEEINDFIFLKTGFLLFDEVNSIVKYEIKNLTKGTKTVTKNIKTGWNINNEINFKEVFRDYEKYKSVKDIINLYNDARRCRDKKLKFLAYYKVLEFKNNAEKWLIEKGEKKETITHSGKKVKMTKITKIRNNICHPINNEEIELKNYLNKIENFAKERIEELKKE